MAYSLDYRKRIIGLIKKGESISQLSRFLKINRRTIYNWLAKGDDLSSKKQPHRERKLDWIALKNHVQKYPDELLRERAEYFNVHISAIGYALKKMKISHKKNSKIRRKGPGKTYNISSKTS